ncbi:hypothetical protein BZG00_10510 [Salinivibrio kushneri]|uniref:NodB homology domain-containing protein n=1 Tax=Salinivibrio kushneri TaxID=1908198 RepID=A0AB36JXI9_9GAMM|nr:hypothetical protein BZG00_10510 [Salinivibrio kushneri]
MKPDRYPSNIIYLHDTPFVIKGQVAANRKNIDTANDVEKYLCENNNVLLSADDGYKSIKNLLPLVEKYRVELLLFITTGFTDRSVYPYEVELSNFLEEYDCFSYEGADLSLKSSSEKESFFEVLHRRLKLLSLDERDNFVEHFFEENKVNREEFQKNVFLDWQELKEIAQHPLVEIGSHCVSHIFLPNKSSWVVYNELRVSKIILEKKLGCSIEKLSYPYGGNNLKTRILAKLAGYKEAYGTLSKNPTTFNIGRKEIG